MGIAWSLVLGVAVAAIWSPALNPVPALAQSHTFPGRLDAYLKKTVRLTDQERSTLLSGAPVTKLLESDPATEVAVFGAVWVAAPPELYVKAVTDIENFEKGENFRITKKISDPPRLDDFAQFVCRPTISRTCRSARSATAKSSSVSTRSSACARRSTGRSRPPRLM